MLLSVGFGTNFFHALGLPCSHSHQHSKKLKGLPNPIELPLTPSSRSNSTSSFLVKKLPNNLQQIFDTGLDTSTSFGCWCGQTSTIINSDNKLFITGKLNTVIYERFQPFPMPKHLSSLKVEQVAHGKSHVILLLEGGIVASIGAGFYSQLGHGEDVSINSFPKIIQALEPRNLEGGGLVVRIAAGGHHNAAVVTTSSSDCKKSKSTIYCWGLNNHGQCGTGIVSTSVTLPTKLSLPPNYNFEQILDLQLGRSHSALLTADGRVYSWGETNQGRLGIADFKGSTCPAPVYVAGLVNVKKLAVGDAHNMALTNDGRVWTWGWGADGQQGSGSWLHFRTPRVNSYLEKLGFVREIHCGATFCAAIIDYELFTWGGGDGGWLGHIVPKPSDLDFIEPGPPKSSKVYEGKSFDSDHDVYLPKKVDCFDKDDGWLGGSVGFNVKTVGLGGSHMIVFGTLTGGEVKGDQYLKKSPTKMNSRHHIANRFDDINLTDIADSKSDDDDDDDDNVLVNSKMQYKKSSSSKGNIIDQLLSHVRHRRTEAVYELIHANHNYNFETKDEHGNTLLIVSAQNNLTPIVNFSLSNGCNPNARNNKGNTALHFTFYYKYESLSNLLISKGADDLIQNFEGLTCYEGLRRADLLD